MMQIRFAFIRTSLRHNRLLVEDKRTCCNIIRVRVAFRCEFLPFRGLLSSSN